MGFLVASGGRSGADGRVHGYRRHKRAVSPSPAKRLKTPTPSSVGSLASFHQTVPVRTLIETNRRNRPNSEACRKGGDG